MMFESPGQCLRIVQNMFLHFLTNIICEVSRIVCKATDGISACLKQAWKTGSKVICKNLNRMSALNSAYMHCAYIMVGHRTGQDAETWN